MFLTQCYLPMFLTLLFKKVGTTVFRHLSVNINRIIEKFIKEKTSQMTFYSFVNFFLINGKNQKKSQ